MIQKLEKSVLLKARTGKASASWLKSAAQAELGEESKSILDIAFPGWSPGRGIAEEDALHVTDLALAYDLFGFSSLRPEQKAVLDRWRKEVCDGTLEETLWRHLDSVIPGWSAPHVGKRIDALRLRAVQLAGFRSGAHREPLLTSSDVFERSLAGWLRRNRLKERKGTLSARERNIILGRIGRWTQDET